MSQRQRHPNEDMHLFFAALFVLGGITFIIWYFFKTQLVDFVRWVRWGELWLTELVVGSDQVFRTPVGTATAEQWREFLYQTPGSQLLQNTAYIKHVTALTVIPLRMLFVVGIGLMGLVVTFFGHGTHYRRRMNLDRLMKEQARVFKTITPFIKFNPTTIAPRAPGAPVPARLPLFAKALSPEEWLVHHDIPVTNKQIDPAKAWEALGLQLGRRWKGPFKLSLHAQALYAVFALKHIRKRQESQELLNELAVAWTPEGGLKLPSKIKNKIRKIIKDPKIGGKLRPYADKHAYETTAILRCLMRAREEGGVLAPAEFVWLRGHDRALWYPLNNLGRQSYHAEATGALVHFTSELISGQKIPSPQFHQVIRGYNEYLRSSINIKLPPRAA